MSNIKLKSLSSLKNIYKYYLLNYMKYIFKLFNYNESFYIKFFNNKNEIEQMLGYKIPVWIKGICIDKCIYVLEYNEIDYQCIRDFEMIIVHEVVHLCINNKTNGNCPQWLNEGLAIILSKQHFYIKYKDLIDNNINNLSYNDDLYYEKCCAMTMKYISIYSNIENLIKNLINNEFKLGV